MVSRTSSHSYALNMFVFVVLFIVASPPSWAQTIDEDFVVGWIHRTPELDYITNSPQPDVDGWPAVGEIITWHAMIRNWFPTEKVDVGYTWLLDGIEIDSGMITLGATSHTAVALDYEWNFDRHHLRGILGRANHLRLFSPIPARIG